MPPQARTPPQRRWDIAPAWDGAADLARHLRTAPLIAQLLHNRGLSTPDEARAFLAPKLTDLHDPLLLPGAAEAAERILRAVRAGEKIALYGDYDVDGMAGLAILHRALALLGAGAEYYIPHRIEEGYGLNVEALRTLAAGGARLVVTVDCGIGAHRCAEEARTLGLSLIITDHHTPPPTLPPAEIVVHPTIGAGYPNPDLCGAGVALKLAWQLCRAATGAARVSEELRNFLLDATCLCALGTVADVVPLTGENRVLAAYGLKGLPATTHRGIRALIAAAGLEGAKVGAYDVGFRLAPRLNAAGRMGHARQAAELLIRPEAIDCDAVAQALTEANTERQRVEAEIFEQACEMVAKRGLDSPEHRAIVLAEKSWHAGVIGIVAARLVGRFGRPAVLIALDGESGQGSARSIPGFHLANAFEACAEHLTGCGGHAMAAGLRIRAGHVEAFAAAFAGHARERISVEMLQPCLRIDAEVRLAELSVPMVRQMETMAPFGAGNPPVVLAARGVTLLTPPRRIGRDGKTLSLLVGHDRSPASAGPPGTSRAGAPQAALRCVGFGLGDLADRLGPVRTIDLAGEPTLNHFNGKTTAELILKDVRWE